MIRQIEELMLTISDYFMAPVLVLLAILFCYSLYAAGAFFMQWHLRRSHRSDYRLFFTKSMHSPVGTIGPEKLRGYPLASLLALSSHEGHKLDKDQLDVAALEELETVRTVSRLAPMLGLIATMVPMGPALKSLADGNVQGISENLIVAFAAVIFGLVIASITFWIASVKKRWLAKELVDLNKLIEKKPEPDLSSVTSSVASSVAANSKEEAAA